MQGYLFNTPPDGIGYPFGQEYWSRESYFSYFRFTGKEFDESNGMYYFGARYYMPEFGIFITPEQFKGTEAYNLDDPLSLKFYDYCRNNPYRFVDPDGKVYTKIEDDMLYLCRDHKLRAGAHDIGNLFIPMRTIETQIRDWHGDILITADTYEDAFLEDVITTVGWLLPLVGNLAISYLKDALIQVGRDKPEYNKYGKYQRAKADEQYFSIYADYKGRIPMELPIGYLDNSSRTDILKKLQEHLDLLHKGVKEPLYYR